MLRASFFLLPGITILVGWKSVVGLPADLGPICLCQNHPTFVWEASLDSSTGRGRSRETSEAIVRIKKGSTRQDTILQMQRLCTHLVSSYPIWLTGGKVTFGLLRTVPTTSDKTIVSIQSRLVNFNLLSFGTAQIKRLTNNECILELPVQGGFFALAPPSIPATDCGCLKFTLIAANHPSKIKYNHNKISQGNLMLHLRSEISGNYCPWLAGPAPVPFIRKWMYLSTQSLVHAYVMWRFHHEFRNRTVKHIIPTTINEPFLDRGSQVKF